MLTDQPNEPSRISAARLREFASRAFQAAGVPADDAATVADLMVQADLSGSDSHGIFRLPHYIRRLRAGGVNTQPRIRVVQEKAATALVDGDNALGHLVMKYAAEKAIEKAKGSGMAWVGVRGSNHAGAASVYASMPLAHDMIGLYFAVGSANHLAPWGGTELLLSTNPVAMAIPTLEEPPVVLDMAPTVAAFGKVKAKAQRDEPMPEGWMIDRQGRPLTDARRADEGLLLPIGGYKGYGLALMFGLLAGTLNGAGIGRDLVDFNKDDVTPANTGQAIAAISVEAFAPVGEFKRSVDNFVRQIRASERLPGIERVWLPGEQSHLRRQERSVRGVPIPAALRRSLDQLASSLALPPI